MNKKKQTFFLDLYFSGILPEPHWSFEDGRCCGQEKIQQNIISRLF